MNQAKQKKLTQTQNRFVKRFIDIAYENMAIEREAPFSRKEAYQRYHRDALDLIEDGTYKTIRF
ncbi:hypothetical protein HY732_03760 [Candidatus Uhrbacteria bacterium]|nr:hypothetical protein [Candidatus Uhrbacteria bacterium]